MSPTAGIAGYEESLFPGSSYSGVAAGEMNSLGPRLSWLPHPQGLAVGGCSNGTVGFKHFNDPQTKNTLSRAFDIIGSNVLKGAIRYY